MKPSGQEEVKKSGKWWFIPITYIGMAVFLGYIILLISGGLESCFTGLAVH